MATTVNYIYNFGTFAYKGYIYVLECEETVGTYVTAYLLSKMYKYDPANPNLNVVAAYTFEKRYITGPRGQTTPYYGEKVDISVDELGGRVLCVFTVGILIDMETLTPTGTNYYKVFAETSEVATYQSGGTIYYAYREGASGYAGDDDTKYIQLDDQYVDSTPAVSNPGLTPLGSMHGLLIPSLNGRHVDYYLSPSNYGFKKQNLTTGAVTEYITPTGMERGYTPPVNYGSGPYWDHTWVDRFIYADDGYVYVFLRVVYGHSYFGLFDPMGTYDICILKYSVGPTGALTEVARKLFSQATTITPQGYVGVYPLYAPVLLGCAVNGGHLYYSFHQYVYGDHGQTTLVKLRCSDLSLVTSATAPDYAAVAAANTGHLLVWRQTFGEDRLLYYCAQGHLHFLDTDFVDTIDEVTLNDGSNYSYGLEGPMYSTGIRGPSGYVIFPGGHDSTYVDFKSISWLPDCVAEEDIPPQDMSAEILTNEFWGSGIDPSYLEVAMTAAARQYAIDNDLLYSFIFDTQQSVLNGLEYIATHHNGFYTDGGGLIAHRQLEIDDEDVAWIGNTVLSDEFEDEIKGEQWIRLGETLYEIIGGTSIQRISYHDSLTIESIVIYYRNISRLESVSFVEIIGIALGGVLVAWNPADKSASYTLSNGNLTATHSFMFWESVRATYEFTSGKKYWEITLDDTPYAPSNVNIIYGIMESDADIHYDCSTYGYAYYGDAFEGDVFSVAYDVDTGYIWFAKNGVWYQGDPATGNDPSFTGISGSYKPAISPNLVATWTANFGSQSWAYTPPSGFSGLDT